MGNAPSLLFGDAWRAQDNRASDTSADPVGREDPAEKQREENLFNVHQCKENQERLDQCKENQDKPNLSKENQEKLNEFKLELARKHEKRRQILAEKRKEMEELRQEVIRLKKENEELRNTKCDSGDVDQEKRRLREENEHLKMILGEKSRLLRESDDIISKNRELRVAIAQLQGELQNLNRQVVDFDNERKDYQAHVVALKDVIAVSKHMIQIRETQLKEVCKKNHVI